MSPAVLSSGAAQDRQHRLLPAVAAVGLVRHDDDPPVLPDRRRRLPLRLWSVIGHHSRRLAQFPRLAFRSQLEFVVRTRPSSLRRPGRKAQSTPRFPTTQPFHPLAGSRSDRRIGDRLPRCPAFEDPLFRAGRVRVLTLSSASSPDRLRLNTYEMCTLSKSRIAIQSQIDRWCACRIPASALRVRGYRRLTGKSVLPDFSLEVNFREAGEGFSYPRIRPEVVHGPLDHGAGSKLIDKCQDIIHSAALDAIERTITLQQWMPGKEP